MKEENDLIILDNSKIFKWLMNVYKIWKERIISYLRISVIVNLIEQIKKEIFFLPVKTVSIILVSAILTNIFFSIILSKEIGLLGWIIRVLFLFIGLGGLFCNADWKTIGDGSFVLRYINNTCKIRD